MVLDWYLVTLQALMDLWQGFLSFLPKLVGAVVVFIVGWFVSVGVARVVVRILEGLRFNRIFERGGRKQALAKAELKVDPAGFVGAIFKWVLVIVFLLAAVEILGFVQFAGFLRDILGYLPNVIVACLIFVVTVIVVDILVKLVKAAVEGTGVGYSRPISEIVRWAVWIFAVLAILHQLGIAPPLIETLFTGLIAVVVISMGLAFGLGGKDVAGEILRDWWRKLQGR